MVVLARGKFLSRWSRGWQIINEVVVIVVVNLSDLKAVWFFLGTCSADFGGVVNVNEDFLLSLALQISVAITAASKFLCFKAIAKSSQKQGPHRMFWSKICSHSTIKFQGAFGGDYINSLRLLAESSSFLHLVFFCQILDLF